MPERYLRLAKAKQKKIKVYELKNKMKFYKSERERK